MDLAIIKNLTPETNAPHVLRAVADWHEQSRRRNRRHDVIAAELRVCAAMADGMEAERMQEST